MSALVFSFDAIAIGAGHNGLTVAGYLVRAGLKTLVLGLGHHHNEQSPSP